MSWNGSDNKVEVEVKGRGGISSAKPAPSFKKGIIAGLIVVVGAGLAAWWIGRGGSPSRPQSKKAATKQIAEVKPQIVTQAVETVAKAEVDTKAAQERKAREVAIQKRREMMKKMTPDERLDFLFEEAKKRPIPELQGTNRIFRTGLEQVMGWVFTCELGDPPPPILPKMSMFDEAHLAEILIMDNPISETDSDWVKYNKEAVQMAKKEFIDFIKQGGYPEDFLPYYHAQLVQAHEETKSARKAMVEVVKNDPDIAPEFIKKVNDGLEAKGIKKVALPPKLLEKYNVQLED